MEKKKEIYKLLSEYLCVHQSQINGKDGPGDHNKWDSLGHMEIIRLIENEFTLKFTIDEILNISSVEDIVKLVNLYK